jgi:hypothetical protein
LIRLADIKVETVYGETKHASLFNQQSGHWFYDKGLLVTGSIMAVTSAIVFIGILAIMACCRTTSSLSAIWMQ